MGNSCSANDTVDQSAGQQQQQQQQQKSNGQEQHSQIKVTIDDITLPHTHCRNDLYARIDGKQRFRLEDEQVDWSVELADYQPLDLFVEQEVPIEEDPDFRTDTDAKVQWNTQDGHVNRKSHGKDYEIVGGVPRNPYGRTGITGRGKLARWGPNHAADPVVTRWKRDDKDVVVNNSSTDKPILQFIAIKRGDTGQWAIPGGFVDKGEEAINALKREFAEEALDSTKATEEEKKEMQQKIQDVFSTGKEVYRGYVDDPRNTDNSWMETTVMNFHDDTGDTVATLKLQAGDDAVGVQWIDIQATLELYASHVDFVRMVAERQGASW